MHHQKHPAGEGVADEQETGLLVGMVRIVVQASCGIREDGRCFLEGHAMFLGVSDRFPLVPRELEIAESEARHAPLFNLVPNRSPYVCATRDVAADAVLGPE